MLFDRMLRELICLVVGINVNLGKQFPVAELELPDVSGRLVGWHTQDATEIPIF